MVVPVGGEALAVRRCQIEVGLEAVAELARQGGTEPGQVRIDAVQRIQDEGAAGAHVGQEGLHGGGRIGLMGLGRADRGIGGFDVGGRAGECGVEILQTEQPGVEIRHAALHHQRLALPMFGPECLAGDRRDEVGKRKSVKEVARHGLNEPTQ